MVASTPLLLAVCLVLALDRVVAFSSVPVHSLQPISRSTSKRTLPYLSASTLAQGDRFDRAASKDSAIDQPCIITIDGIRYNLTAWAKAHPGGEKILLRFHGKDASAAFHGAAHSKKAYAMLADFAMDDAPTTTSSVVKSTVPRWRQKLFTKEDPRGIHKTLGVFCLLNFAFRFLQMYFGDPSAGLGSRLGKGPSWISPLCLLPHGMLSLSSLIFHTVPRERVVGKPMIWQEYRIHNISFGLRSVLTAFLGWLSIAKAHAPAWRRFAVLASCVAVLSSFAVADEGTKRLRANELESTTATMPYWEGCSLQTQRRFKSFYAYCQFLASLACLQVSNPAWALAVLIPIQLASLLMTLVRKGLISARQYHIGYTISLIMPYFVGLRGMFITKSWDLPVLFVTGWILYQLRRRQVNKYLLWVPVVAARAVYGDRFINYQVW